jgi:hypothetical protein
MSRAPKRGKGATDSSETDPEEEDEEISESRTPQIAAISSISPTPQSQAPKKRKRKFLIAVNLTCVPLVYPLFTSLPFSVQVPCSSRRCEKFWLD